MHNLHGLISSTLFGKALLLALAMLAFGCDGGSEDDFDVAPYLGTYEGTRTTATEGDEPFADEITVVFEADEDEQTATITLNPEFGPSEVLTGRYDEDGLRVDQEQAGIAVRFLIGPDGDIEGEGTIDIAGIEGDVEVSGVLTRDRFDLFSTTEITVGNELNPPGTITTNDISTTRADG